MAVFHRVGGDGADKMSESAFWPREARRSFAVASLKLRSQGEGKADEKWPFRSS